MEKECPICGNKTQVLYENLYDKDHFVEGKFSMQKCPNCEFEFLSPSLNEKQLTKYYPSDSYYSYHKRSELAIRYHKISAYYFSRKNLLVNFFLFPFESLLYHYRIFPGKKLLEIGCGNGMQLEIYNQYGLKTAGLEPYGPKLTEREKKLGIERKSLKNAEFKKESFDLIVMKEVLEHIPDQAFALKKSYELLKKDGKIIIIVPNTDSFWNKMFGKNWYGYDVPRHLYNYNPKNIRLMLEKMNFKVNNIKKYDLPYMADGSLKFWITDKNNGKNNVFRFIFSSLSKLILAPVSLLVTYLGQGAIMEIEAKKNG